MRHPSLLLSLILSPLLIGCPRADEDEPPDDTQTVLPDTADTADTWSDWVPPDTDEDDTAAPESGPSGEATGGPSDTGPTGTAPTDTGPPRDTVYLLDVDTSDTADPITVPDWTACPTALPASLTPTDALWTLEGWSAVESLGHDLHLADIDGDGQLDLVSTAGDRLVLVQGPLAAGAIDRRDVDAVVRHTDPNGAWPTWRSIVAADLDGDGRDALYVGGTTFTVADLHRGFTIQVPRRAWTRGTTTLLGRWDGLVKLDRHRPVAVWRDADGPGDDALVIGMPGYDPTSTQRPSRAPGGLWIERDPAPHPAEPVDEVLLSETSIPQLGEQLVDLGDPDGSGAPEWAVSQLRRVRVYEASDLVAQGGASAPLATISPFPDAARVRTTLGGGRDVTGDGVPDLVLTVDAEYARCGGGGGSSSGIDTGDTATRRHSDGDTVGDTAPDTAPHTGGACDTGALTTPSRRWSIHVFAGPVRGDLTEADAVASVELGYQYGPIAPALTPGDLDGDGIGDLVLTTGEAFAGRVDVLPGPVSGTLALPASPVLQLSDTYATTKVGDLTGDGRPELVIGDPDYSSPTQSSRHHIGRALVYELCPAP